MTLVVFHKYRFYFLMHSLPNCLHFDVSLVLGPGLIYIITISFFIYLSRETDLHVYIFLIRPIIFSVYLVIVVKILSVRI